VHELGFGNRLRQDRAAADRINKLVQTIEKLVKMAGDQTLPDDLIEGIAHARLYRAVEVVDLELQQNPADDEAGLLDFSRSTVEHRRDFGYRKAKARLGDYFGVTSLPSAAEQRPSEARAVTS